VVVVVVVCCWAKAVIDMTIANSTPVNSTASFLEFIWFSFIS
jgi:hypothetical protein